MGNENKVFQPSEFFNRTLRNLAQDYHRVYLFEVQLPKIGNFSGNDITYFVANTQSPVETTGTILVDWMNSQIKIGGRTTYSDWSVTVRDSSNSKVYDYFRYWRSLVYETASGQSSLPKEYKFNLDLMLLNNRGIRTRGYLLVNAFPTNIGQINMDYSTESIITFTVTFNYDEFIPKRYS